MQKYRYAFLLLFMLTCFTIEASPLIRQSAEQMAMMKKKSKRSRKKRSTIRTNFSLVKTSGKIYVFGFAHVLGDSVAYITNINEIDSIDVQKNTKFLPFRSDFSLQFKIYLEAQCGLAHETSTVFYSKSRAKLVKKFNKIKKRYLDSRSFVVKQVNDQDFHFVHPLDRMIPVIDEEEN